MTIKQDLETYATECRAARDEGRPLPVWRGGDLRGADLRGADLRGAHLRVADLTGADLTGADLTGAILSAAVLSGAYLTGATIAEGPVTTHATGRDGGYGWHAMRVADGGIVLQYGCERHPLATWQARGPEYGARHGHDAAHWAIGPAVAIAAAVSLITESVSTDLKENP